MKRDHTLDPRPIANGPSAALEAELRLEYWYMEDQAGKLAIADEIAQLRLRAFRDPVPEEDLEWARLHRERAARAPLEPVKGSKVDPAVKERLRELRMKRAELKILPLAPGPSAVRETELVRELYCTVDPAEREALLAELLELDRRAKREPVPEEDAEWARAHREGERGLLRRIRAARRDMAAELAYRAYCESEGIAVDERALATRPPKEFYWVGDRMIDKPDEPEEETLTAALAVYAACTRKEPPRPSEAWLAAIRKVREILPKPNP